jgi:hypothetical protein
MSRREFTLAGFQQSKQLSNTTAMQRLSRRFGNDGYATYLKLCEFICNAPGARLSLSSEGQIKTVVDACHLSGAEALNEIISTCVGRGLFCQDAWNREMVLESPEISEQYSVEKKRFETRRTRSEQNYGQYRHTIYSRDDGKCVYCGSTKDLTLDHVIPVSRGGAGNHENLATCCKSCNSSKGARTPEEWKGRFS